VRIAPVNGRISSRRRDLVNRHQAIPEGLRSVASGRFSGYFPLGCGFTNSGTLASIS
jgi:pantoate kinase